jgi:anti-sigma factor RsiW
MEHAREIELIELAAGRLAAERERAVLTHLEDCQACRTRLHEIRRTWDLLGAWQVQPAGHVDAAGPGALARSPRARPARSILRFAGVRTAVRIAAAIAVSMLVGYAGGRWSIRPLPADAGWEPPAYFSVLGFEVGDSFSSLVLQDELSSRQEG